MDRYQETVHILYARNRFEFNNLGVLSTFASAVPAYHIQTITNVEILYTIPFRTLPSKTATAISSMKSLKQLDIFFYPCCVSSPEDHLLDMLGLMRRDIAVTLYLGSPSRHIMSELDSRSLSHVQPHPLKIECSAYTRPGRLPRIP
jgi:hypothetical protein